MFCWQSQPGVNIRHAATLALFFGLAAAATAASPAPNADDPFVAEIDILAGWPRHEPRSASLRQQSATPRRPTYQRVPGDRQQSSAPVHPAEMPLTGDPDRTRPVVPIAHEMPMAEPLENTLIVAELPSLLPIGPPERYWFEADYLLWWIKGMKNTPPLVTTSDPSDQGVLIPGNSTRVLFPTDALFRDVGSGGRIRFGAWLDPLHENGIEADGFGLRVPPERFRAASGGTPLLARPFFDTLPAANSPNAEVVATTASPAREGEVSVLGESDLYSAGVRWRWNVSAARRQDGPACAAGRRYFAFLPWGDIRLDFTFGYRYARLDEQLSVFETVTILEGLSINDRYDVADQFRTENDFHAAEIGMHYSYHRCRLSFDLLPRLAFGNTRQRIRIDGSTLYTPGSTGISQSQLGGLLALEGTNIGNYRRDMFSIMPQMEVRLGYRISNRIEATFGYSFLYWMEVARPGEQMDYNVNSSYFPSNNPVSGPGPAPNGPRDPRPQMADSAFWAQGLTFGIECRF